jgi:N-acetyl-anhydromuramyl-L-alanine amidase AmpD
MLAFCGALLFAAADAWAQPDYGPALWNPAYPGHWYTSDCCHSFCVIHDMEGYYEATISYFQAQATQASIHYCVCSGYESAQNDKGDPGGQITQMVREQYWAWHVLCWNGYMFGTEHEGFVSSPAWYTTNMYQASAALQRHLCDTYGIQKDRNHIIGHNEWQNAAWRTWMTNNWPQIDPTCNNHTDPGQYWDWTYFMSLITSGAPVITQPPTNVTVAEGGTATLNVAATGQGPLTLQWQRNGTNLPGATFPLYRILDARISDAARFSVTASNPVGVAVSSPAYVSVVGALSNAPGAAPAPPGLINWWPGDGNARDICGTNDGQLVNDVSYSPGQNGPAFQFAGQNGSINISGGTEIPPPWTAAFWVNRQDAFGASAALLGDATNALKLEQYNQGRKAGFTHFGAGDYVFNYIAPAGVWTHLVFVGTSAGVTLYANGAAQATVTPGISLPRALLGADSLGDNMAGALDEIMIYNKALTASQIGALYAAGPMRAPQFGGPFSAPTNGLALNLVGLTGKTFTLFDSTNFVNWSRLATVPNPTGTAVFTDPGVTNQATRFYRLRQP